MSVIQKTSADSASLYLQSCADHVQLSRPTDMVTKLAIDLHIHHLTDLIVSKHYKDSLAKRTADHAGNSYKEKLLDLLGKTHLITERWRHISNATPQLNKPLNSWIVLNTFSINT